MTASEVIRIARQEVGYMEKRSCRDLDSKTENTGSNNFTKYARDYAKWSGIDAQGQAWCDVFVDWCFIKAFGIPEARKLLGGFSAYTPTSSNCFKNMGKWYTKNPQPGDVIFFKNSTRICHTGIVEKVSGGMVYTIEGNTSNAAVVVPNGGQVCQKSYALTNSRIAGYGRPAYSAEQKPTAQSEDNQTGAHVPLNYIVGKTYTVTAAGLNVRTKKASEDPSKLPGGHIIATLKAGKEVKNQATTLVNGKIWMYLGLDSKKREKWACADNGRVAYIR